MIKVYIASPYTVGDTGRNVKAQIDTFIHLLDNGYLPFAPLFTHFVHIAHPKPYNYWTAYDNEWLKNCDVILRLPGESPGADNEVELARSLNIPVVRSLPELINLYPANKKKAPLPLELITPSGT